MLGYFIRLKTPSMYSYVGFEVLTAVVTNSVVWYITPCSPYNWATLFLGDVNTGTWPSRLEGGGGPRI
jgi:hypothetical protein